MSAKEPAKSPVIEKKLDQLVESLEPDATFARDLRARIMEQAVLRAQENPRRSATVPRARFYSAWRLSLALVGMAFLVAFLVFSIGLLPRSSLAPAGGSTPAGLLPTASPTVEASPEAPLAALEGSTPQSPLPEFPLNLGTRWIYSYTSYNPLPSDPNQIITATYIMTETVTQVKSEASLFTAKVQTERQLVSKSAQWAGDELSGSDAGWYVIAGNKVYSGGKEPDLSNFEPDLTPSWTLAYQFPLKVGDKWCPVKVDFKTPDQRQLQDCRSNGELEVAQAVAYETPTGSFDDCSRITESYNSGGTTRWFCNGVGLVAARNDHAGTLFGFEKTLVSFVAGSTQESSMVVPTEPAPQGEPSSETISGTQSIPSSDGRWTVVLDRRAGSLDVTGPQGESYPLFPAGSTFSVASWSPDSLHLVVVLGNWPEKAPQSQDKGIPEIWMVSFAGGAPGEPAFLYRPESADLMGSPAGQISLGSWSPDSRRLLFWTGLLSASIQADGMPLWLLDVDSSQASLLSQATLLNPAYQSWAPDGSTLVFTDGGYRSALVGKHLSIYNVSSGQVTTLVPEEKQVPGALAWSPDGAWIAYAAVEASQTGPDWADLMSWDNPAVLARRIYLLNPQSGETWRLDQADAYQDAPRWRADGKRLFYAQLDGNRVVLMSADPANGTAQALTGCSMPLPATTGYYGQVDWRPLYASCPKTLEGAAPGMGSGLSMDSSAAEIRQRILNPTWDTLWLQSQATLFSPTGVQENFYVQAWLDRSGTGRVLSSDQIPGSLNFNLDMDPRWVWTSDGQKLTLFDEQSGQFDPSTADQRWFIHPLEAAGQAMGMLFPSYLAPRSEGLQLVSMEQQAGRPALVVDWAYFRLWVDTETGVLLRQQTRNEDGSVSQDIAIQSIAYDLPLPRDVLSTENLENIRFEAPPNGASSSEPATSASPPQASIPSKIIFSAKTSLGVEIFSVGESSGQPLQLTHDSDESAGATNTGPACSPDGSWIAFTGQRDGQRDIYLMRPDGSGETRLTGDAADDVEPTFSPDGAQIAFVSQRDGHDAIYIINLDGAILGSLADLPGSISSPAWSPDGSRIAFSSKQDGLSQIYVVNLDGSDLVNLSNYPGSDYDPAWSPDGSKIAFYSSDRGEDGQDAIYVIPAQGGPVSVLAAGTPRQLQRNMGPAWSPDGKWITFYSNREGYVSGIFETPADGSGQIGMQIALTPNTMEATNPCWLPVTYDVAEQQGDVGSTERIAGTITAAAEDPNGQVNIRSGPSTMDAVVGRLPGGSQVVASGRTDAGDWIQIEYPQGSGQTAWVYYALIQLDYGSLPVVIHPTPTPG